MWKTLKKTTLIQKNPRKRTAPNNYRPITCLLMMWKILRAQIREKIHYSLTSRGLFPYEERMLQRIQRHSRVTLHRSAHPEWEQDQTKKSRYGLDWLQKDIWHGSTKLDNELPQNVQNIYWCHAYRKNNADLESGADSRRNKLCWNKNLKRYFLRRCTIILTIHNSRDAT